MQRLVQRLIDLEHNVPTKQGDYTKVWEYVVAQLTQAEVEMLEQATTHELNDVREGLATSRTMRFGALADKFIDLYDNNVGRIMGEDWREGRE